MSRNLWQTTANPEGSPDLAKPRNGADALWLFRSAHEQGTRDRLRVERIQADDERQADENSEELNDTLVWQHLLPMLGANPFPLLSATLKKCFRENLPEYNFETSLCAVAINFPFGNHLEANAPEEETIASADSTDQAEREHRPTLMRLRISGVWVAAA